MVCNTNDRCSLYPSPDSTWIELCPANWREAFKADTLRKGGGRGWVWVEVGGGVDLAHQWGTNGKYPATALNDRTVIEMYSECLKVQTFSTITFCHFIKTCVWLCLCLFVCVCVRIFSMPSSVSGLVQSNSVFLFCYYTTSAVELKETRWTKTKSNPMKTLQEKNTPVGPLKPAPGL